MKGGFHMMSHYSAKKAMEKESLMFEAANTCMPQFTAPCSIDACLPMYATAYVKFQQLCTLYNPMEGLERGTIFPELYSPYL
jgi:hypothetical protein